MIVKLKKPYTLRLGSAEKGNSAQLIIPADKTLMAEQNGDTFTVHTQINSERVVLELRADVNKSNIEVVVS